MSDRICLEHGLSIIEEPKGRGVSQYLYKMEKAGMMTRYNVARQAIDEAVALSVTMEEFQTEMKNRGYLLKFDPKLKYWSIVPPGWKKPIRIHKLGEDYTRERIQERISDNDISVRTVRLRQQYRIPNNYSLKRRVDRTIANAIAFSDMQAKKHGWKSYGDKQYPAHVLRYYPYGSYNIGVGNTAIVQVAAKELGNHGGKKFWSWYGFKSRDSWCGCFVSWCADQCGYIKSGTIPKFSYVPDIVDWAKSHHHWQSRNYKPSPGDIIIIDWHADGTRDHVGFVEKCDGRTVFTIEGNRSDAVMRGSYRIGSGTIYGFVVPKY